MKRNMRTKIVAAGLGLAALLTLAVCNNDTGADACGCADIIHGDAPCDCGGAACVCEQKEYALAYNVKVINETGERLRSGLIADITNSMTHFSTADVSIQGFLMSDVSARHAEIIITNGTDGGDGEALDGDTIKIGKQYLSSDNYVLPALEVMFYDMLQEPDPKTTGA